MRGRRPDPRRLRLASPQEALEAAESGLKYLDPPSHLDEAASDHWRHLVESLADARVPITEADQSLLVLACELWSSMRQARQALDEIGFSETSQRGSPTTSAAWRVYKDALAAYATIAQRLGLGPAERLRFSGTVPRRDSGGAWETFRPLPRTG